MKRLSSQSFSHCAALVRERDYDRYLCTLFAPWQAREAWTALFAFNQEIASVGETVSEDMIGFMRFAWWREALDEIYAGKPVRRHPVAESLAATVRSYDLPRAPLDAMLEAREARLGAGPFEETAAWEDYFAATSSALLELCAVAARETPTPALHALGMGWAYIGTARGASLAGEAENAQALRESGEAWLQSARADLPDAFHAFRAVAAFYLGRLTSGKKIGKEARGALVLRLCWQRLMGQI